MLKKLGEIFIFILMYVVGYAGCYVVFMMGDMLTGLASLFSVTIILLSFFAECWKGPKAYNTVYLGKDDEL